MKMKKKICFDKVQVYPKVKGRFNQFFTTGIYHNGMNVWSLNSTLKFLIYVQVYYCNRILYDMLLAILVFVHISKTSKAQAQTLGEPQKV